MKKWQILAKIYGRYKEEPHGNFKIKKYKNWN